MSESTLLDNKVRFEYIYKKLKNASSTECIEQLSGGDRRLKEHLTTKLEKCEYDLIDFYFEVDSVLQTKLLQFVL